MSYGEYVFRNQRYTRQELLQLRAHFVDTMESILNKAKHEGRDLKKDEVRDLDRLQAKIDTVSMILGDGIFKDLDLRTPEGIFEAKERLDQPVSQPWRPGLPVGGGLGGGGLGGGGQGFYARHFPDLVPTADGFQSLDDFFGAIISGRFDERLLKVQAHLAGVGETGGFAIPTAYAEQMMEEIVQSSIILGRAPVEGLTAIQVDAIGWSDLDQSSGALYGGFKPVWQGEEQEASEQEAKLRMLSLHARKISLYTSLSRELEYFSKPNFGQKLREALIRSVSAALDTAFLLGSGVGQPAGILTANPALITVNRGTANTIVYLDVVNMLARLHPAALEGAIWIANNTILPKLLTMKDESNALIWQPSGRDATPDQLMGKPIFWHDRMPALGNKGDLLLCNPRFYQTGLAPTVWVDASNAPEWFKDKIHLRAVTFADGASMWPTPYTPPEGDTLSWAVALAPPA